MKTGPATELRILKRSISEIEQRFLSAYLTTAPALKPPSRREQLDIAAYVVLAHGALENFAEGVALWVLTRSVDRWKIKKRVTRATASILLSQSPPAAPDAPQAVYDTLRLALEDAKNSISRHKRQ